MSSITDLAADTYIVTATDDNGCTAVSQVDIINLGDQCMESAFVLEIQLDQFPSDISYILTDSNGSGVESENLSGFSPGDLVTKVFCLEEGCYHLSISDAFGDGVCASYSSPQGYVRLYHYESDSELLNDCFFVESTLDFCIAPMVASLDIQDPSCIGWEDGNITVNAIQGSYEYSYLWSTGQTTSQISGLQVGVYAVTVSDGTTQVVLTDTLIHSHSLVINTDNNGEGSLRAALNNGCNEDTVTFSPSLLSDTIVLYSELIVDKEVVVQGLGRDVLYISGGSTNRLFHIANNGVLSLRNLQLIQGFHILNGGAFYNQGQVILENIILDDNKENTSFKSFTNDGDVKVKGNVDIR